MRVVGLFSGIGGLELGFRNAGFDTVLLNEIDPACRSVLASRFNDVPIECDIMALRTLPRAGIITAGFPCKSFSQAGRTGGLSDARHLLAKIITLLRDSRHRPEYVVLENVKNIIHLERGEALRYITRSFESLGYSWAYRVVDASAFGLPQRRKRWIFVASLNDDAAAIVLGQDRTMMPVFAPSAHGFYWTEGNTGLGWADDAVPPLKAGSGVAIPSPPAIWVRRADLIVRPSIGDAERLQGFPLAWTRVPHSVPRFERLRWKMVGNAVSVPMAEWVGRRIAEPPSQIDLFGEPFLKSGPWPKAAYGWPGERYAARVGEFPVNATMRPIMDFLDDPAEWLSARATRGFRARLERSSLRYPPEFLNALRRHEFVAG
jgi:DNA (cytosine-5)-methyltransferase 1